MINCQKLLLHKSSIYFYAILLSYYQDWSLFIGPQVNLKVLRFSVTINMPINL